MLRAKNYHNFSNRYDLPPSIHPDACKRLTESVFLYTKQNAATVSHMENIKSFSDLKRSCSGFLQVTIYFGSPS